MVGFPRALPSGLFTLQSDLSRTAIFQTDGTTHCELRTDKARCSRSWVERKAQPSSSCLMVPKISIKHVHSCFTVNVIWPEVRISFALYVCMNIRI